MEKAMGEMANGQGGNSEEQILKAKGKKKMKPKEGQNV
jgi:hypothetical protein